MARVRMLRDTALLGAFAVSCGGTFFRLCSGCFFISASRDIAVVKGRGPAAQTVERGHKKNYHRLFPHERLGRGRKAVIILIDSGREVFHKAGHRLRYLARQAGQPGVRTLHLVLLPGGHIRHL